MAVLLAERGEELGDTARELVAVLLVEVVAHLPHLVGLGLDSRDDRVVGMAEAHGADAGETVDVLVAGGVHEDGAPAGDELDGQPPIGVHDVGLVALNHARGYGAPDVSRHSLPFLVLQKHGADALVGKNLEQQRMWELAIYDNDLTDSCVERVVDGLDFRDHSAVERLRLEKLLGL